MMEYKGPDGNVAKEVVKWNTINSIVTKAFVVVIIVAYCKTIFHK